MKCVAVVMILLVALTSRASAYDEAAKRAAQAAVIQWGIDKNLTRFIERNIPKEFIEYADDWAVVGKLLIDKRLEYKWEW
jgi:hypothetical protein